MDQKAQGASVIDRMAAAALARVQEFINRSAGQHLRAIRSHQNP